MKRTAPLSIAFASVIAVSACSRSEPVQKDADPPQSTRDETFSLLGTRWTYPNDDGETIVETIAPDGNYVSTVGARVVDQGTVTMLDGKACFDSFESDAPPNCWSVPDVAIGETKEYVDDHGQRLRVTRVDYIPR